MRNIKLTLAYDGTDFHGFQEQRGTGLRTVQEVLEKCLARLAGRHVRVTGAGRTDAGVHARGQVVNFLVDDWRIPLSRVPLAFNGILPGDVAVLSAEEVPEDFHARFSATSKTYCYAVYNSRIPSPFWRRYSYFVPRPLDVEAMREAAKFLTGTRDFKAFQAAGSAVKDTVRTIYEASIDRDGPLLFFTFRGNGFLYNMVRIMVGTLLEVGLGKYGPSRVAEILEGRRRVAAGPTVPPQGLCLERVDYD